MEAPPAGLLVPARRAELRSLADGVVEVRVLHGRELHLVDPLFADDGHHPLHMAPGDVPVHVEQQEELRCLDLSRRPAEVLVLAVEAAESIQKLLELGEVVVLSPVANQSVVAEADDPAFVNVVGLVQLRCRRYGENDLGAPPHPRLLPQRGGCQDKEENSGG